MARDDSEVSCKDTEGRPNLGCLPPAGEHQEPYGARPCPAFYFRPSGDRLLNLAHRWCPDSHFCGLQPGLSVDRIPWHARCVYISTSLAKLESDRYQSEEV
jgi:hypothetical protein